MLARPQPVGRFGSSRAQQVVAVFNLHLDCLNSTTAYERQTQIDSRDCRCVVVEVRAQEYVRMAFVPRSRDETALR